MALARLIILSVCILAASVYGDDAINESHAQLAERLVDALGVDEPVLSAVQVGIRRAHAQSAENTPALMQSDVLDEITQVFFEERFSRQALKTEIVEIYVALFTEKELREMVEAQNERREVISSERLQQLEVRAMNLLASTILDEQFQKEYAAKLSEGDQRAEVLARITVPTPEPDRRTRTYIECRSNKLFRITERNHDDHGDDLSGLPLSECMSLLEQHKGTTVDTGSASTNWFIPMLLGTDEGDAVISFIVCDDSIRVFKKARALAWIRKFQVDYELLEMDVPLQLDDAGVPVLARSEAPKAAPVSGTPRFSMVAKEPVYVDVYAEQLVLFPDKTVVPADQLDQQDTPFDDLLAAVKARGDEQYLVLIMRPGSAKLARSLRERIAKEGVDCGYELLEMGVPLEISQ